MTPAPTKNDALRAHGPKAEWKAFSFETGHFLLHVPSSHVLEAPEELARHVRGEAFLADGDEALAGIAAELPQPPARDVKTDIRAISLNMAQGCNLRCVYCFAGEGDYGKKAMMSLDTAKKVVSFFTEGKDWFHITFFGGEPLLNFPVMKDLVAWCETLPVRFSYAITTNGTLLNDEKLAWLKDKKVAVTLSYDGHGLQARQRLSKDKQGNSEALVERKLKAFDEQLHNLRSLLLRSTVTRVNLDILEESILSTLTAHNYLTVSAEGHFHLCHRFNEDQSESFGDVDRGLDPAKLEAVRKFRGADQDPCKSCWMREWCAGGCLHENKAATGSTFDVDPVYCKLQAIEIEQAMRVYTILKEKAPHLLEA